MNVTELNDRELKKLKRCIRLRRERRRKTVTFAFGLMITCCMIMVFATAYGSIKTKANNGFKYYTSITVEAGDSLSSIADEYIDFEFYRTKSTYIAEVMNINHIENADEIMCGQKLIVPYYSSVYIR